MSYNTGYGPVCLNGLADRKPAQLPLQLTFDGRTIFYYPTGWTGQYVRVSTNHLGGLSAQLTVGIVEGHPIWKHLRPASLDAQTAVEHALAIARELAAVDSMVPSSAQYDDAGLP